MAITLVAPLLGTEDRDHLFGTTGDDILLGLGESDEIEAGAGNDRLEGARGNDWLDGGTGADTMLGGAGNDIYVVDDAGDRVYETLSESNGTDAGGKDLVYASVSFDLTQFGTLGIERLVLTGTADLDGIGNGLNNRIIGNAGANRILGAGGIDWLEGGSGADTLDGGADADKLYGGTGRDELIGGAGNDRLDGGAGIDTMVGGAGDDSYRVDDLNDLVDETAAGGDAGGQDTIFASVSLDLWAPAGTAFIEALVLTGTNALNGAGNALANRITGNGNTNWLYGYDGNDSIDGGAGGDMLFGGAGRDDLTGGAGSDYMTGDDGNDRLDGGAGIDAMYGGAGNDTYIVDAVTDQVEEYAGLMDTTDTGGADTVNASVSYTLSSYIETLNLIGAGDLNGTGNASNNSLTGTSGANVLSGLDGHDRLRGNAGNDSLIGGNGDDRLDGGTGADTLAGGAGNDVYILDSDLDRVIELASNGFDQIRASASVDMSQSGFEGIENVILTGTGAIECLGNALNNVLTGNAGDNILHGFGGNDQINGGTGADNLFGGDGADTLLGGAGNDVLAGDNGNDLLDGGSGADRMRGLQGDDTYIIDNVGDTAVESDFFFAGSWLHYGTDRVLASVSYSLNSTDSDWIEHLTLTGTAAINATGNELANRIVGNSGDNRIAGGLGADTLRGGVGHDTFVFDTAAGGGNIDRITDFWAHEDVIALEDAVFAALAANGAGTLGAPHFAANAAGMASTAVQWVIYETDTGALYYDADGSGAGARVQFATLAQGLAMTASHFEVI